MAPAREACEDLAMPRRARGGRIGEQGHAFLHEVHALHLREARPRAAEPEVEARARDAGLRLEGRPEPSEHAPLRGLAEQAGREARVEAHPHPAVPREEDLVVRGAARCARDAGYAEFRAAHKEFAEAPGARQEAPHLAPPNLGEHEEAVRAREEARGDRGRQAHGAPGAPRASRLG